MKEADAEDRSRIIILFALAGAASGVLIAMLCLTTGNDGFGRTNIGESTLLTLVTTILGSSVGATLSERPGPVGRVVAMGVLLLTGLLGAAMGWLVGDALMWPNAEPLSPSRAVAAGALAGLLVGALVLVPRWLRRTRSGAPKVTPPSTPTS